MTFLSDRAISHLSRMAVWPDLTGTRYTAVREVGRGGMGTVYLAVDTALDREVALKVVNTAGEKGGLTERLRNEARILARLDHPGIVPVHDVGVLDDGRAFYVMKLVRGESLAEYAARLHGLTERLRLFERICEPVAFAHARGFVHRDLKPQNIMVGPFGEVLVMDWGIAKALGAREGAGAELGPSAAPAAPGLTDPGTVVGTPGFMAPEQASGGDVDQRTDVYALGAILYTLLAGSLPPDDRTSDLGALFQSPPNLPKRLRAIGGRALALLPGARYANAGELGQDVDRFLTGGIVAAYPETVFDRAGRVLAPYRTAILLVVAYLVMRVAVALSTGQ